MPSSYLTCVWVREGKEQRLTCSSLIFFCNCMPRACSSSILLWIWLISKSFLWAEQTVLELKEKRQVHQPSTHTVAPQPHLLLQFLIQLLLIIFQIHYAVMGQLQVSFEFPLSSLKVHAQFLLLLQGPFQLNRTRPSGLCQPG